jgi:hypothetical protein
MDKALAKSVEQRAGLRKVYGGTRSDQVRLCDTCHRATIMQGPAESQELVMCALVNAPTPFRVVQCSDYSDKRLPSLHDMKEVAWILRTDQSGRKVGFLSAEQWRKSDEGKAERGY